MLKKKIFLLFIICFSCFLIAEDKKIHLDVYDTSDGLIQNNVNVITQDDRGFLWIGTQEGLNRFDGHKFKSIEIKDKKYGDSVAGNYIYDLIYVAPDKIWIGTHNKGIVIYNLKDSSMSRIQCNTQNSIPSNYIRCLVKDKIGNIWIATIEGLRVFDKKKQKIITIDEFWGNSEINMPDKEKYGQIALDHKGNLWITSTNKIFNLDLEKKKVKEFNFKGLEINKIRILKKEEIWLCCENELIRLNLEGKVIKKYSNIIDNERKDEISFFDIIDKGENNYYVCTFEYGLILLNEKQNELSGMEIMWNGRLIKRMDFAFLNIFRDSKGVIWFATSKGLVKENEARKRFSNLRSKFSYSYGILSNSLVWSIIEDKKGDIWIATSNGLNRIKKNGKVIVYYHKKDDPNSLPSSGITGLKQIGEKIWIGTAQGLAYFENETLHRVNFPLSDKFKDFLTIFNIDDTCLWLSAKWGGLFKYDFMSKKITHKSNIFWKEFMGGDVVVYTMIKGSGGIVWQGTSNGLFKINLLSKEVNTYHAHTGTVRIKNNKVLSLFYEESGLLWVGSSSGLELFNVKGGKFERIAYDDGVINSSVYQIIKDDCSHIWVGASNGLYRFKLIDGKSLNINSYKIKDGLLSEEFNLNANYKDKKGICYLGNTEGVCKINPQGCQNTSKPMSVTFTGVQNSKGEELINPYKNTTKVVIPYKNNYFKIRFSTLDYRDVGRQSYNYMLEGVDKKWQKNVKSGEYESKNLPPGKYRFVVYANRDSMSGKIKNYLDIEIERKFLENPINIAFLSLAILILLILFVHRYMVRKLRKNQEILEGLVNIRTKEFEEQRDEAREANRVKSDFLARVSHDIRTPMNSIIGFTQILMETPLSDEQKDYTRSINTSCGVLLQLINDILDISKIEAGEMELDNDDFDLESLAYNLCELLASKCIDKNIEVVCKVDINVPQYINADKTRVSQVIINLMNNAIKFTDKGFVELSIVLSQEKDDGQYIHLYVKDTGIGIDKNLQERIFEDFKQVEDKERGARIIGTGLGLGICKRLATLMGGKIEVQSEKGVGTTFHFYFKTGELNQEYTHQFFNLDKKREVLVVGQLKETIDALSVMLLRIGIYSKSLKPKDVKDFFINQMKKGEESFMVLVDTAIGEEESLEIARIVSEINNLRGINIPIVGLIKIMAEKNFFVLNNKNVFNDFLIRPVHKVKMKRIIRQYLENTIEKEKSPITEATKKSVDFQEYYSKAQYINLLVAEDNVINRKLFCYIFDKIGFKYKICSDGEELLKEFKKNSNKYDIILMDLQMPRMDGFEATRRLRQDGYVDIPIIAISAQTLKGDEQYCLNIGMNDFITKPIDKNKLLEVIFKYVKK